MPRFHNETYHRGHHLASLTRSPRTDEGPHRASPEGVNMPTPTAYFEGDFVPLSEAKIGIMTHAFNYGTAVFEGVRGNWNAAHDEARKSCDLA